MEKIRIAVCGIACEKCPRRIQEKCPNGPDGCYPRENKVCKIASCAFTRNVQTCFECTEFPCKIIEDFGQIKFGYCQYISGKL